jgi:PadR family transcriptional regulator, regulatory protein PadR
MDKQPDLLEGTLDMLILKAISLGPFDGYGNLLGIQQIPRERLEFSRVPGIPCSATLNTTAGLKVNGENRKTTGVPAISGSSQPENAGCNQKAEPSNQMTALVAGVLQAMTEEL